MSFFLEPETHLQPGPDARASLIVGAPYTKALEALRTLVADAVQRGKRIYCFDGSHDWAPENLSLWMQIRRLSEIPRRFPPVFPAGELRVIPVRTGKKFPEPRLVDLLAHPTASPPAEIFLFHQVSPYSMAGFGFMNGLIENWKSQVQIFLYEDARTDGYLSLTQLVDELLVYPHAASPELLEALWSGYLSAQEFADLKPGQFVRIPDPLNTVQTLSRRSFP